MANTFAPFGFQQWSGTGSAPTYEQVTGFCAYNTAAMYFGDPIYQNSDGSWYPTTPGTGMLAGVFTGCKYLSVALGRTVWRNSWGAADVASTNTVEVYAINDPNAKFKVQVGGSTSVGVATTDIGANVQFAYGTPNTLSGISGAYLDISVTPTTTSTLPFKVVGLITDPPGAPGTAAGVYNLAIVSINFVTTKTTTGV